MSSVYYNYKCKQTKIICLLNPLVKYPLDTLNKIQCKIKIYVIFRLISISHLKTYLEHYDLLTYFYESNIFKIYDWFSVLQ